MKQVGKGFRWGDSCPRLPLTHMHLKFDKPNFHFAPGETEDQRGYVTRLEHTVVKEGSWDLNPGQPAANLGFSCFRTPPLLFLPFRLVNNTCLHSFVTAYLCLQVRCPAGLLCSLRWAGPGAQPVLWEPT